MIAVISDVHFPSNAERQKIMETGLKKLTGIRALFICGDFTDNRKDTKPEEEMKLPEYIKKLPYPVFFIDGNHEDYDVLKRLPKISDSENELLFQKSGCSLTAENTMKASDGIYYLKRGSVCKIDGFSILLIGGSTTGPGYKKNHPDIWQKDEDLSKEDEKRILKSLQENNYIFDLILTHTVPECMVKAWFPDKDLSVTNRILEHVWQSVSYQYWLFGHFHKDANYPERMHCLYNDVMLLEALKDGGIRAERRKL